ncbi:hypothetical protein OURE66S_02686 [Oligella ureolytica]
MLKIPKHEETRRPTFSGHETFPMRYGWLKKSYDALNEAENNANKLNAKDIFSSHDAIAKFGVGKNMVNSMRHWCNVTNILEDNSLTPFAKDIFKDNGFDPYLENPMTLWIIHYSLATNQQLLTYYWFFNINNLLNLDRKTLQNEIEKHCTKLGHEIPSSTTVKRDVECFVRLYMYKTTQNNDDAVESPLTELGLIVPIHKQGYFAGNRGAKSNLSPALFWASVFQFWNHSKKSQKTLNLSSLAYDPLSPGRVFLLDENSIVEYIYNSSHLFNGQIEWSETAGMRQLEIKGNTTLDELISKSNQLIEEAYKDEI